MASLKQGASVCLLRPPKGGGVGLVAWRAWWGGRVGGGGATEDRQRPPASDVPMANADKLSCCSLGNLQDNSLKSPTRIFLMAKLVAKLVAKEEGKQNTHSSIQLLCSTRNVDCIRRLH